MATLRSPSSSPPVDFCGLLFAVYAAVRSGSLAIAASTLDSLLNLKAGGIMWFTHSYMNSSSSSSPLTTHVKTNRAAQAVHL